MPKSTIVRRSTRPRATARSPLLLSACAFVVVALGSTGVAACPNASLRSEVEAAIATARKLPDDDRDGLEQVAEVLRDAKRLGTQGESLCKKLEQPTKVEASKVLLRVEQLLSRGELTLDKVFGKGVDEQVIQAIKLDGEPLRSESSFPVRPGRRTLQVKLDPRGGDELRATLERDGEALEPRAASAAMTSFVFEVAARARVELVLRIDLQASRLMYVVTNVARAESSTDESSSKAEVDLRLNGNAVEPGKPLELSPGAAELSVIHPVSTDERWFHVQATIDGMPLQGEDDDPSRETYRFAGLEGKTRTIDLAIDSDRWPNPVRPWAIWGGAALAVVGTGVGLWQRLEGDSDDREAARLYEDCLRRRCDTAATARLVDAYDRRDAAWMRAGWAFGFAGVGTAALIVGLVFLEPGRESPEQALRASESLGLTGSTPPAVRVVPTWQPGLGSVTVSGRW